MRNRSREEFEGSDALKDLGIRIANSVGLYGNTQQLIENDRAAKSIRKEIKRAERRLQATDAEKNFASGVAAGNTARYASCTRRYSPEAARSGPRGRTCCCRFLPVHGC